MTTTQASTTPPTTTTTTEPKKSETKEKNVEKNRVYVGNLSYRTTSEELKAYFLTVCSGVTSAEVISYPNGRSKGCGLVEFKSPSEAEKAIKELNNTELASRKIFIREDREEKGFQGGTNNKNITKKPINRQPERRIYNYNNNNNRNYQPRDQKQDSRKKNTDGSNLYVGNLPYATQDQDLKSLFEDFGEVVKAEVSLDRNGRSKGFGIVKMNNIEEANAAIVGLNEHEFQSRKLVVRIDNFA